MTRFLVAAASSIAVILCVSAPACGQSDQGSGPDSPCFPWQEWRGGRCVPKPASPEVPALPTPAAPQAAPAAPAPVAATPAMPTTRKPTLSVQCDGGAISGRECLCPSGFDLTPPADGGAGGVCVKTHADNCQGGELTVAGACLCNGHVTMSGEVYELEYAAGKCVPKRCPVDSFLKGGKCVALSDSSGTPEPAEKHPTGSPRMSLSEGDERHHCGRGMVHTRSGCAPARHRYPVGIIGPGSLPAYSRGYPFPGSPAITHQQN